MEAITDVWVRCVKHTARSTHMPSAEETAAVREARWRAAAAASLHRSLAEAEQARLRESTAAWQAAAAAALAEPADEPVACYEVQVVTGDREGAGTTAHVYLELVGAGGSSGEHRLVPREGGRPPFAAGATDAFRLHCRPLGPLLKVGRRVRRWRACALAAHCLKALQLAGLCFPWPPPAHSAPFHACPHPPAHPAGPRVPQQRRHLARLVPGGGAGAAPGRRRPALDPLPLRPLAGGAPGRRVSGWVGQGAAGHRLLGTP